MWVEDTLQPAKQKIINNQTQILAHHIQIYSLIKKMTVYGHNVI